MFVEIVSFIRIAISCRIQVQKMAKKAMQEGEKNVSKNRTLESDKNNIKWQRPKARFLIALSDKLNVRATKFHCVCSTNLKLRQKWWNMLKRKWGYNPAAHSKQFVFPHAKARYMEYALRRNQQTKQIEKRRWEMSV